MKVVVFDAETVPAEPVPEDQFPALDLHRPVVLAWLETEVEGAGPFKMFVHYGDPGGDWEREALEMFRGACLRAKRLITFNGRTFDMPLLNLRATAHKVDWSWWLSRRHRYENYKTALYHYDLMEVFGDQGGARNFGLAGVSKMLGLPGKVGLGGGGAVKEAVEKGELARAAWYCTNDVLLTWMIYLRAALTFYGAKEPEVAKQWAASLEWIGKQAELAPAWKDVR